LGKDIRLNARYRKTGLASLEKFWRYSALPDEIDAAAAAWGCFPLCKGGSRGISAAVDTSSVGKSPLPPFGKGGNHGFNLSTTIHR
jgi:hypothetical protein